MNYHDLNDKLKCNFHTLRPLIPIWISASPFFKIFLQAWGFWANLRIKVLRKMRRFGIKRWQIFLKDRPEGAENRSRSAGAPARTCRWWTRSRLHCRDEPQKGFSSTPSEAVWVLEVLEVLEAGWAGDRRCLLNTVWCSLLSRRPADLIAAASADAHMIQQLVQGALGEEWKAGRRQKIPPRQS